MTDRAPDDPTSGAASDQADLDRRRFFRQLAGDVVEAATSLIGTVASLRQDSLAAAQAILDPVDPASAGGVLEDPAGGVGGPHDPGGPPSGFRAPFRASPDDPEAILLVDQRRLPDAIAEHPIRSAADAAWAIRSRVVRGSATIGQVAALGLALTAEAAVPSRPHARRAILHGAANALRNAAPSSIQVGSAVDRLMARYDAVGELFEDGQAIAAAVREAADAIIQEATTDHGRLAGFGVNALPWPADGRELRAMTIGATGPLAGGQFGTALGVIQAAHHRERPIHVWIGETRPDLLGARITAWELRQAGVRHTVLADAALASLLAGGEVDVVLVGADRIAANGDVAAVVGTYPLAVLAARHGVPFYVVAALGSVDPSAADGSSLAVDQRASDDVLAIIGQRIAPPGTAARNPAVDVTPADLISAIVTEEGVLEPPFGPALVEAADRRAARWAPPEATDLEFRSAGSPEPLEAHA